MAGGTMLAQLRTATRPAHDALEGSLGLLDEQLDRDSYTKVLQRFYGFWQAWEPRAALLLEGGMLAGQRRLHLLAADLATLGVSASAVAALPACPPPELRDAAEALGSLYVMEGSTLGGRVILRNVERCLGLDASAGGSYFAGYGAATGSMWRAFLVRLDGVSASEAERVAAGATATFERLGWWLGQ